jgi:ribosomal protein S6--L-glutamate ligase
MRILVLSRNIHLYSTSRIVLAARARGHEVTVVDPLEFQLVLSKGRPSLMLGNGPIPEVDLVIPRIGASITNYGLAVVRQFDLMGIPVVNNAVAIARSRDKLRAMQLLTRRDVDVPRTVCAKSPAGLTSALSFVGGTPAIVKLQQGAQGIGTMIAETPQALTSLLETLWAMGQDIILQEYISESKGRDIRAFVVGGKVIASMRRQAKAGEFRSNLHRGGEGVAVGLDREYARTAVLAAKIMGLDVCGVDMLEGRDGPKVLEINSSPGLEGIERTSGVDVATALIKHGEKLYAARTMRGALSPDSEVSTDRVPLEPVPNPRSRAARKTAAAPRKTAAKTAVKTAAKTAAKAAPKAAAKTAPKTAAKTAVKTATKTARKTAKTA